MGQRPLPGHGGDRKFHFAPSFLTLLQAYDPEVVEEPFRQVLVMLGLPLPRTVYYDTYNQVDCSMTSTSWQRG